MWRDFAALIEPEAGESVADYVSTGMAVLDVPGLIPDAMLEHFETLGIAHRWWDADDLAREIPGFDPAAFGPPTRPDDPRFFDDGAGALRALHTDEGGYIRDPMLAAENFVSAAKRAGATMRFGAEVVGLGSGSARRWRVDLADGDSLEADVVVNAAGPWSPQLTAMAGAGDDHTIGQRALRQEVHTAPAESSTVRPDGSPIPAMLDLDLGTYLRAEGGGQLLIGNAEPECDPLEWLESPDDTDLRPRRELFDIAVMRAAKRLTGLSVPNRVRGVVGVYDVADDWTPIYDRSSADGFYLAVGTSGNQFKNAPMVGRILAELIEAVEGGSDHDADPVSIELPLTGGRLDLGAFSRRRAASANTGTVMG